MSSSLACSRSVPRRAVRSRAGCFVPGGSGRRYSSVLRSRLPPKGFQDNREQPAFLFGDRLASCWRALQTSCSARVFSCPPTRPMTTARSRRRPLRLVPPRLRVVFEGRSAAPSAHRVRHLSQLWCPDLRACERGGPSVRRDRAASFPLSRWLQPPQAAGPAPPRRRRYFPPARPTVILPGDPRTPTARSRARDPSLAGRRYYTRSTSTRGDDSSSTWRVGRASSCRGDRRRHKHRSGRAGSARIRVQNGARETYA